MRLGRHGRCSDASPGTPTKMVDLRAFSFSFFYFLAPSPVGTQRCIVGLVTRGPNSPRDPASTSLFVFVFFFPFNKFRSLNNIIVSHRGRHGRGEEQRGVNSIISPGQIRTLIGGTEKLLISTPCTIRLEAAFAVAEIVISLSLSLG